MRGTVEGLKVGNCPSLILVSTGIDNEAYGTLSLLFIISSNTDGREDLPSL